MCIIKLALSEYRRIDCDAYIYPEDVFDIEDIQTYSDINIIEDFAMKKLKPYIGKKVMVYVNAKLSTELLSVIKVSAKLDIELSICHRDQYSGEYKEQKVIWKGIKGNGKKRIPFSLCQGRHIMPIQNYIFNFSQIPQDKIFDYEWMDKEVETVLGEYKEEEIEVYISGLPSLYISVLNVAYKLGISVTFMHYDCDVEDYFSQNMN